MTAPIDIECPHCKSTAGNYCTITVDERTSRLTFHHAERVDAAFRDRGRRQNDPRALRAALSEALRLLESRLPADVLDRAVLEQDPERAARDRGDLSFIITTKEDFQL